jgi:hypothetical protein
MDGDIEHGSLTEHMKRLVMGKISLNSIEFMRLRLLCHERYRAPKHQAHVNRTPSAFANLIAEGMFITIKGILEEDYFKPEQITRAEKYSAQMYYELIKHPNPWPIGPRKTN